jgi:hypothetical protein
MMVVSGGRTWIVGVGVCGTKQMHCLLLLLLLPLLQA